MSSPLAVAAVSAVLRNLLDNGLIEAGAAVGNVVKVTAVAPDTINLQDPQASPQLNIFLHQLSHNAAWRNNGLPSRSSVSGERLSNAPLALDLHYVITAYAQADFHAEILLGYAMHLLHERAVLDRAAIRRALQSNPVNTALLPPAFQALAASDLAEQVELIKITPAVTNLDDTSKLWSALQCHYRPSAAYLISVVLIEGSKPGRRALPVLSRGPIDPGTGRDRGVLVHADMLPAMPTLLQLLQPKAQANARLGDTLTLQGARLAGSGHQLLLTHRLKPVPVLLTPSAINAAGTELTFTLPGLLADQSRYAPGLWSLRLRFTPTGEPLPRETNSLALLLAPDAVITADAGLGLPAASLARGGAPARVTVALHCRPQVLPQQSAQLMLGDMEATALPRTNASAPLQFEFPDSLVAGPQRLRLRVDGVDSLLLDLSGPAPVYDPTQQLVVPP
ncbi:hypothetical protein HNP55_001438 [Paucibacter oligotrophus]|uniref:Pvc16 N-terminal domain-containing protein n=1 Tax=Roseateles oligotrophus TaxID=1769250 RepID=A0A840L825_9BURK|nr:DUF4255 domain-containing protein [Roseateles oligotrophus]MBB4842923.1 hypothetical protein [Roseateles oligotrophus]